MKWSLGVWDRGRYTGMYVQPDMNCPTLDMENMFCKKITSEHSTVFEMNNILLHIMEDML